VAAVAQDGHVEEATWPTSGRMARCTLLLLDKRVRWMLGDAGTGLDGNYAVTRCRPWKLPQDKVAPSITRASPGNTRAGGGVVCGGMIIPALDAYATSGKRG
jgi:hypothetical protein